MLGVTLTRYFAAGKLPSNSRVQVLINVVLQRTYSKCDKVRIKIQRSEGWKLLNEVDESGDVDLTGQDGSTPAHASVLKKSAPYFQALLSERWFRGMSSEEKRELPLPVPADGETVKSFLKCLYGVPVVLQVLEWRGTSMFEDVYQLADACSARQVCFQIAECVQMTETNIPWWIEWLKEEHPQNEYKPIKRRVCEFMQKHFAARWDCFEPDTLRALWGMNQGDRVAQERLKCALKERKSASDG
ncbi:hypothetical protein KFL_006270070 [Klebsormidium nitens]|uniref:BTB domain-containing protein n=1 Tax=Klebsormidium nitens TaxID=105231 RepID=A0A1Y1IHH8_KLENI|nr:hypothetical protein KFL_006270070 [Klebsormidium nitens]|eukprot:GAQ90325.1 hypothetical protein KFL_006270070 [Klebsormidium nitens]